MALATSVTGAGKLIAFDNEGSATWSYTRTVIVDEEEVKKVFTHSYKVVRTTRKWYALTLAACQNYLALYPDKNISVTCTNERLNSYELTVEETTETNGGYTETTLAEE